MFKLTFQSILQTLMWTVITGMLYPLVMTVGLQLIFPYQAGGSLVMRDGKVVGSELLSQGFQTDKYFWPRPSACSYGTGTGGFGASGASKIVCTLSGKLGASCAATSGVVISAAART